MKVKRMIERMTGSPMGIVLVKFWQLPQIVLGALVSWLYQVADGLYNSYGEELVRGPYPYLVACLETRLIKGAVTIGDSIIMPVGDPGLPEIYRHEVGHVLQSVILGPLYLPLIGLPSLTWCALHTWCAPVRRRWRYMDFITERWAERLSEKFFADVD